MKEWRSKGVKEVRVVFEVDSIYGEMGERRSHEA